MSFTLSLAKLLAVSLNAAIAEMRGGCSGKEVVRPPKSMGPPAWGKMLRYLGWCCSQRELAINYSIKTSVPTGEVPAAYTPGTLPCSGLFSSSVMGISKCLAPLFRHI